MTSFNVSLPLILGTCIWVWLRLDLTQVRVRWYSIKEGDAPDIWKSFFWLCWHDNYLIRSFLKFALNCASFFLFVSGCLRLPWQSFTHLFPPLSFKIGSFCYTPKLICLPAFTRGFENENWRIAWHIPAHAQSQRQTDMQHFYFHCIIFISPGTSFSLFFAIACYHLKGGRKVVMEGWLRPVTSCSFTLGTLSGKVMARPARCSSHF